ncbi:MULTISPECIES: hypothetical protein [unclassified Streptomyces]|uniref:hypothetical protein n=1 Tax=unclassified Streptomyces TaxID=2593676 RepID=UPI0029BC8C00|nr:MULTISPECIES: hypothetical protein [unclassified Streptomyces]MDX3771213.1 hypothetical protein [Streptomyces sp. AK08-01B]MDX3820747.1 hypothetical protein [Streptomyces sp. AK08-01A]
MLALASSAILAPVHSAAANDFCVEPLCGDVDNRSGGHQIKVAGCWPNNEPYIYKAELGCDRTVEVANGHDGDEYYWDIDGFRAYGGCITYWKKNGVNSHIDRTGLTNGSVWIKISNDDNVVITSITCL